MIRLESVSYRYKGSDRDALSDVSVEFRRHSSTAIVGPNGAGKSTLVRLMNGLLRPTSGRVLIDDSDTSKMSVAEIARKVGVVFQNPNHQIFAATVREEVGFALKNFAFPQDEVEYRVNKALEMLGLSKYAQSSPFMLSSGEKKRLTIACVIAYEPEALIFDEPTVGQDHRNKMIIGEMIHRFSEDGKCVVCVTHDLDFAFRFFEEIIVLWGGHIRARLPVSEAGSNLELALQNGLVPTESMFLKRLASLTGFRGEYEAAAFAKHLAGWTCR